MLSPNPIKLNCDLGEGFGPWRMGEDAAIMPLIDQANIACGFHAGDTLPFQEGVNALRRWVPPRFRPDYAAPLVLRLIPGSQFDGFSRASRERLFKQTWRLSTRTDRMGARLEGQPLDTPQGLISEGIALGAVQVPPDGQPLILLQDRQTLGGYPKLGAIHPLDLTALAQRLPGTPLRLEPTALAKAQREMRDVLGFFGCLSPRAG